MSLREVDDVFLLIYIKIRENIIFLLIKQGKDSNDEEAGGEKPRQKRF